MTPEDAASRAVEAVLFASEHPMTVDEIRAHVGPEIDLRGALAALEALYAGRGIELVRRPVPASWTKAPRERVRKGKPKSQA